MSFPSIIVARYFQLITQRNFAEAERLLEKLKQQASTTDWSKGYLSALEGMLIAQRSSDDRYALITKLELEPKKIADLRVDFTGRARNRLHEDYDRGFFAAWADYMRVLLKWKPWTLVQQTETVPVEESAASPLGEESEEVVE